MFKISLVNPRMFSKGYKFFPIAMGALSGALVKEGIEHDFFDMHMTWASPDQLVQWVEENGEPDLFAVTGLLTSFPNVRDTCAALRKRFPKIKIAVGGRISVMPPEFLLDRLEADYIMHGEGEIAIVKLVEAIQGKCELNDVPGLAWRHNGGIAYNGEAEPVHNIEEYSIPYERFDLATYIKDNNIQSTNVPSMNILSSRGCPFKCTFCNNSLGKKAPVRYYAIEPIAKSLDYMIEHHGLEHVTFNDDIFTVNKERMEAMCAMLKERGLTFSISTRLDFLDQYSIDLLEESGCKYLCVGIESPSPTVAGIIDKRLNLDRFNSNIDLLKKSSIVANFGFMIGYLGETEETIAETREFVMRNEILYSAFFTNAFPQTKLYEMIKDRIQDEEEYLTQLYTVDLSKDYLINMTDIPKDRLFSLRDGLVVDSLINVVKPKPAFLRPLIRLMGLAYLRIMRKALNIGMFKYIFEFININIIKPLTKK